MAFDGVAICCVRWAILCYASVCLCVKYCSCRYELEYGPILVLMYECISGFLISKEENLLWVAALLNSSHFKSHAEGLGG